MLSNMNSRCEVYLSYKKCSKIVVNIKWLRNQIDQNGTERKHNGWTIRGSWEVGSSSVAVARSDEPLLLLSLLLFGLI